MRAVGQRATRRCSRLPLYARGKVGTVERDYGVYACPDANVHFQGVQAQHVYSVRFARALSGGIRRRFTPQSLGPETLDFAPKFGTGPLQTWWTRGYRAATMPSVFRASVFIR